MSAHPPPETVVVSPSHPRPRVRRRGRVRLLAGLAAVGTAASLVGCAADAPTAASGPATHIASPGAGPSRDVATLLGTPPLFEQTAVIDGLSKGAGREVADDFVVPAGAAWKVTSVLLSGYSFGATVTFAFRTDSAGLPSAAVPDARFTLAPTTSQVPEVGAAPGLLFSHPTFTLPAPVTLAPGRYWLVVTTGDGIAASDYALFHWKYGFGEPGGSLTNDNGSWVARSWDFDFALGGTAGTVAQSITFPAVTPNPALVGATVSLGATASSGLAVTYGTQTPGVCRVIGSTLTFVAVGACTVTADQAGTAAYDAAPRQTQTVAVVYAFTGFFSPVNAWPTVNSAKAGGAIPLKFALGGSQGLAVLAAGAPSVQLVPCHSGAVADSVEQPATAGSSGLSYDAATSQYTYVWKTDKTWAGSCRLLTLTLVDGTSHQASFQFTR